MTLTINQTTEPLAMEAAVKLNSTPVIAEIIAPLTEKARHRLNKQCEQYGWQLKASVTEDLLNCFEIMIARLSNTILIQRYTSFFLTSFPMWRPKETTPGKNPNVNDREKLDAYIAWEKQQKLMEPDGPYPELARLISVQQNNWLDSVTELLERIKAHQQALQQLLPADTCTLESLSSIEFGISDPHENGRTAAILTFETGKVVYKPRSLDGEYGWQQILNFLMSNGLKMSFYLPKLLRFNHYGFMEFIDNSPYDSEREVKACFEKYGAITAIAHAFGTHDLHHENIIVSKHGPVVVDAEPLFRCILAHSDKGEERLKIDKSISFEDIDASESVIDIGMLPFTLLNKLEEKSSSDEKTSEDYVVGALHPFNLDILTEYVPCGVASDHLQLLPKKVKASAFPNLPVFNHQPQLPSHYIEQIERGFQNTHNFLVENRQHFLADNLLFDQLKNLQLRHLLRPTMQYGLVFHRSISAQLLASQSKRKEKIQQDLQLLGRLRLDNITEFESLEVESLLKGDIPRFEIRSDATHVGKSELIYSPLSMAKHRYSRLNEQTLALQLTTIREKIKDSTQQVFDSVKKASEGPNHLQQHAFEIVDSIVNAAHHQSSPGWTFTTYAPGYGSTMVHADRESLYEGAIGTAVAIAEAARQAREQKWMALSRNVFSPIIQSENPACIHRGGGMARGLGGLIYSMIRVSDAGHDSELLQSAVKLAKKHSASVIKSEALDEILHGRSGLLLALLALYRRTDDGDLEPFIQKIGETLVDSAVNHRGGYCWRVLDGHSLPNMSHGTSGIAMALARWYQLSGSRQIKELICAALDYDNSFWHESEKGWIDARVEKTPNQQMTTWTWCNGRSGALLSRLAIADALGIPFLQDPLVETALSAPPQDILQETSPGLCCGTPGLVDSMLKINEYCQSETIQHYVDKSVQLIAKHSPKSHYSNLAPALFTGSAGLAFSLLRAAKPNEVKSLLWFE